MTCLSAKRCDPQVTARGQSRPIYTKLETIRKDTGSTSEGLFKRLHFTSRGSARHQARKELHELVATFGKLVEDKAAASKSDNTHTEHEARFGDPPDPRHRILIHKVYNALESKWDCGCAPLRHRAKMCLKRRLDSFDDDSIASLDMLISVKDESTGGWWHEGCVVLDPEP